MDQDPQPVIAQPAAEPRAGAQPAEPSVDAPSPAAPQEAIPSAAPTASRASTARILNVALIGALVLAVAGIGFAGGRLTAPTLTGFSGRDGLVINGDPGSINGKPGGGVQPGPIGITDGGGPTIEGTVESITDTTLTIKTQDGQTMQISLDGTTTYHSQTDASADDVATGGKVLVRINLRRADGTVSGPSASDVTVVP